MSNRLFALALASCIAANAFGAEDLGRASGNGMIERPVPAAGDSEFVGFDPHFSYAFTEGSGANKTTWLVLTEKEPPTSMRRDAEARQLWCEAEKTIFVAVKFDAEWKVDLYFLCPANGAVNTEMVSSWNGLESVVVDFEVRDATHIKGTLRTGTGSCPDKSGEGQVYCTKTGDYTFDAPLTK